MRLVRKVAEAMQGVGVAAGLTKEEWELLARKAITAMREPTGAMKNAGAESYGVPTPAIGMLPLSVIDGQPSKAWRAMIDAALA